SAPSRTFWPDFRASFISSATRAFRLRSATYTSSVLWLILGLVLLAGVLCVLYGIFVERTWFRLRRYRLDILPAGASAPVRVLHLSDLHFTRRDGRKARFIASLPSVEVTVVTGDLLGEPESVDVAVAAVRPARGRVASYFVL